MKVGSFKLPVSAGGTPDLAVVCPAGGYILNPLTAANGWFLIFEAQNIMPANSAFAITLASTSGEYGWDLGDGTILVGDKSVTHNYLTTKLRTFKLYGRGTCNIATFLANNCCLSGTLDFSHSAFRSLKDLTVYDSVTNRRVTSITLPSATDTLRGVTIGGTLITGIDISMFTAWSISGSLNIIENINLVNVTMPTVVTGAMTQVAFQSNTSLPALNVSMFTSQDTSNGCTWNFSLNTALTTLQLPASVTGKLKIFRCFGSGITGTLDLSMYTVGTTATIFDLYQCPNASALIFPSTFTGTVATIATYSSGYAGTINISMFTAWSASGSINMSLCPNLTAITPSPTPVTGSLDNLNVSSCNLATLDIRNYRSFGGLATIDCNNNQNLASILVYNLLAGTFNKVDFSACKLSGTTDVSMFTNWTSTGAIYLDNNVGVTNVTFSATTITGFIRTLDLSSCALSSVLDFTKLKTGIASLNWNLANNALTAAIVNQMLNNINTMSASGFTGRVLNIGGSNSDPDTTSGGVNGVAARTSLQGKSFTVTIT